jgi:hypothetical protein
MIKDISSLNCLLSRNGLREVGSLVYKTKVIVIRSAHNIILLVLSFCTMFFPFLLAKKKKLLFDGLT